MGKEEFVISIPMPFTGESIVDGILVGWKIKPGDKVTKGQQVAELETEKSVWEFEVPCAGEIVSLKAAEGDVVDVGATLFEMHTDDVNMKHLERSATEAADGTSASGGGVTAPTAAMAERSGTRSEALRTLSPRIRKMLQDNNISDEEALTIEGTGPEGRITAADIGRHLDEVEARQAGGEGGFLPCYVVGIGTYTPSNVVGNEFFLKQFDDINEGYIEKVTGIRERRWSKDESTSDLAFNAAKAALEAAGLGGDDLDLIIVATTTPDMPLPATACAVQQKLGCVNIPAFDIAAACSGWLYALSIGRQYVLTGAHRNVLVVAAEVMSKFTDKTDRATAFLFGDGAGAAILSSSPGKSGGHEISDIIMQADSSGYDIIYRRAGGSTHPPGTQLKAGDEYWYMDGGRMFRSAVTAFSDIIEASARLAKIPLDQFDWIVPHQANQRILKSVAHKLGVPIERFFFNIEKYGNTSAASIPLALKDLESTGKLKKGDKILLCAVGAGLTIAGGHITW
jgi:3-oxoacyl-(acyl-carrier-protein) synthase III